METRHGIGTFVTGSGEGANFRIVPEQVATLRDVIAVLELRIGVEAEAAALAAVRRSEAHLQVMREAQAAFARSIEDGTDAVAADRALHMEIARASQNPHFVDLMQHLGDLLIPRSRVNTARLAGQGRREYLLRVLAEHDSVIVAIANRDPEAARAAMRTHLSNSRERLRRAQEAAENAAARHGAQGGLRRTPDHERAGVALNSPGLSCTMTDNIAVPTFMGRGFPFPAL